MPQSVLPIRSLGLGFAVSALVGCAAPKANTPGNGTTIPTSGDARVHSQGTEIVDGAGDPLLLRCVNIDGWIQPIPYLVSDSGNALLAAPHQFQARLDDVVGAPAAAAFWDDWRTAFLAEADFQRMAALGFNCARLPAYTRAITTLEGETRVLDEDSLATIDRALDWGQAHGVYIVLDLHAAPGGQNGLATVGDVPPSDLRAQLWEGPNAAKNQTATVSLWSALAERYADRTALAGYDLLNEPALPAGVPPSALPELYGRIIEAVRAVDAGHLVFVEGDQLAHDFSAFTAPLDDNLAYSFHAYALTGFEDWATPDKADIQAYLDLRQAHQRPLWLGEFGEQTQEWQTGVITLVEAEGIGWALYPWKRKQTWFFNPVLQRIPDSYQWYVVAAYLAQPQGSQVAVPTAQEAAAGMAEILDAVKLENCLEDGGLANGVIRP